MATITRQEFLAQCSAAGLAAMIGSVMPIGKGKAKVRVGIIGCGSVSRMYLPHLTKSPDVELVSVCDIRSERAETQAKQFQVANIYDHIDRQLAGAEIDLLVNLTDMQEHGRLNGLALKAGKHVWSEKPLANSYQEGKVLLDLAQSKHLRLWGAPAVVNSPQFAYMARQIHAGTLGSLAAAHAHYGHQGPSWSAFFYEKGGGSLPDLGVYNLATLTGLLGPVKSIVAMTSIVKPQRKVDDKGDIHVEAEDNAMVLMEHSNGVISHVQCGFNYFDPYGHEGEGQDKATISIWGSQGNMHMIGYDWAPFGVDLSTVHSPKPVRHVPDAGDYVWEQGASVVAGCLANGTSTLITPEHTLHVLEIIEAANKSQAVGKRIPLVSTFKYPIVTNS
jgi:predicted dehydrogenase